MARFGDLGPYAVGNVKIILRTENTQEAWLGRSHTAAAKAKVSATKIERGQKPSLSAIEAAREVNTGSIRSDETCIKIGKALEGNQNALGAYHNRPWSPKRRAAYERSKLIKEKIDG